MTDLKKTAKRILKDIGGKDNITQFTHCFTRLRFNLVDNSKVDQDDLAKINGVKGVAINSGQLQIIIGNDVDVWYDQIAPLAGITVDESTSSGSSINGKGFMAKFVDLITGIFIPIFPALATGGLMKGLLIAVQFAGWVKATEPTFQLLMMISDVPFYFLPMILAFSAAKKMGANQYTALIIAGTLLHPTYTALKSSTTFLGITVPHVTYSSTVFPILISVAVLAVMEKFFRRYIPKSVAMLFVPLLSVLVTAPIALVVVGPVANWLGELIGNGLVSLYQVTGLFGGAVFGAIYPFLVFTSLHQALPPIELQSLASSGVDVFLGLAAVANASVAGVTFMAAMRTKDEDFRALAIPAGISAILGTTEPAIYGVLTKSKRNFIAAFIGGGIGGAIIGAFKVTAVGMGPVPIPAMALFAGKKFIVYVIAIVIAFLSGMIALRLLGKESAVEVKHPAQALDPKKITSPIAGNVIPLSEMKDETFASGVMGEGVAIVPSNGEVYSPMDATVEAVFPTKHAIGLSNGTTELIIHVGINTVELQGEGFTAHVAVGDVVKKGDRLLSVDLALLKAKGYDPTTAVIISNSDQVKITKHFHEHEVVGHDDVILATQV